MTIIKKKMVNDQSEFIIINQLQTAIPGGAGKERNKKHSASKKDRREEEFRSRQ